MICTSLPPSPSTVRIALTMPFETVDSRLGQRGANDWQEQVTLTRFLGLDCAMLMASIVWSRSRST